jgi:hypothetical protein
MNFLAPWFLLGALAVAGPVLFHLIRRSARERVSFSSLLFLRPVPPRATRRRKIEHVALMLLRCLAVLLLAIGFARPFFSKTDASPPPAEQGRQTVVLLDTSASMRREGLWTEARSVAERYIKQASLADRVAVMTFDQQPRALVSFADWSSWPLDQRAALAEERVDAVSPGWAGTHLGLALTTAAELFSDTTGPCDVVLISDLQEGAKLEGLQGYDWPKGVRVIIEQVDPKRKGNAGVEVLDASKVRIVNARDSDGAKFQLSAENGKPEQIYLPPGQMRTFPMPSLPAGATTGALHLTGDDEDFDNTSWFAAPETEHAIIAYFGTESANDPAQLRYYLQRAFPESGQREVEVVPAMTNSVLNQAALAIIPASLDADQAAAMRNWLTGGKTALIVLTNAQAGATLAALAGGADIGTSEAAGDYALLGDIDFNHPIFAPFADPRFSDFSRIHFWKHRDLIFPPGFPVRVLAKFDDGTPAVAQVTVGKGNLLIFAAGWNPADSQLALSSKFLPLMQTILDWSGGGAPSQSQFEVGDSIPSPIASGNPLQWRKPDGKIVTLPAGTSFAETDMRGIYTVTAGGKVRSFAVNLPLDESRTAPMSPDDLGRLGVPLQDAPLVAIAKPPGAQRRPLQVELENRQKIWRWLIAGLLGVALVEIVLGGWLAGRVAPVEVAP